MQKNKLALSLEETDVVAFCYEIFLSFKDVSESKNMDFRFEPSQNSYKMPVDKGNLDKVIYNLLSNAFKYTPSNGKIIFKVDVQEQKKQLCIQVIDTGLGIPKEKRAELFKRFMQSSFSHSSVGVGLHLTYGLINIHKGTISYNENEGGGSIFTFEIKGGREEAFRFIDSLEIFSLLANVADVKSLVIHPASTTHSQLNETELAEQGITQATIRLSIGTEHIDDLLSDLTQAFAQV